MRQRRFSLVLPLAVLLGSAVTAPALAQGETPLPGQSPELGNAPTPLGLSLGEIHWYPVDARCRFFLPERAALFDAADPDTWRFVLVSLRALPEGGGDEEAAPERAYVMADGLLRELEKNRESPDGEGGLVTVWRSAGEPRLNVDTVTRPSADGEARIGEMTVFWGDRDVTVPIAGDCASDAGDSGRRE